MKPAWFGALLLLVAACSPEPEEKPKPDTPKLEIPEETPLEPEFEEPTLERESEENPLIEIVTDFGMIVAELFPKEAPVTVENFIGLAEGTKEFTDIETGEKVMRPFYDGLTFHRIIDDFMIQGGCPRGDGSADGGYSFKDEINARRLGIHKIKAVNGRTGQPHPALRIRNKFEFNQVLIFPAMHRLGIRSQSELQARRKEVDAYIRTLSLMDVYQGQGYRYSRRLESRHPTRGVLAMANSGANTNGTQFFINVANASWLAGKHTVFGKVLEGMEVVNRISKVEVDPETKTPKEPVTIHYIRLVTESEFEEE